jgi:hypothetical protein
MGFNKRYIPDLETLKERRKRYENDEEFFKATVGRSDALIGPPESIDYLDSIYEEITKKRDDNDNRKRHNGGL